MKTYWFRRKRYGWGWTPRSWQGWLVTIIFVGFIIHNVMVSGATKYSDTDFVMTFLFKTLICISVFIGICYITGEKPRWQWGEEKRQNGSNQNKTRDFKD